MFLVDEPFAFVDRDVGLALQIGLDRLDLVFAEHAASLIGEVDGDLRPDLRGDRTRRREGAGKIIEQADSDRLVLGERGQRGGETENGDA